MEPNHLRFVPKEFIEELDLDQIKDDAPKEPGRVRLLSIPDEEVSDFWR
jgi:hypothetical protein